MDSTKSDAQLLLHSGQ